MASSVPEQYRAVDPFASYNSNTVNQLTEMVSRGENVLDIPCSLDVVMDSTSPLDAVVVQPGYVYKDDVMIYVSEDHKVDFNDPNQYITFSISEIIAGYYYIVLQYTYIKSRPAPQAQIKIVTPNQRNNYDYGSSSTSLIFLKAVYVSSVGPITISSLHDYDPSLGYTDNKRKFVKRYAGSETDFDPTDFEKCRDQSRVAYDITKDQFYFGYEDRWEPLNVGGTYNIDTTAVDVGQLCYVDSNGKAAAAIATAEATGAEMVAIEIGLASDGSGQARLSGYVEGVLAETGVTISTGDLLYLSNTEAGLVTNVKTSPLYQVVGRAVSDGDDITPFNILFFGRAVLETGTASRLVDTANSWTLSGSDYYYDVDITSLGLSDQDVIVSCRDVATNMVIQPGDIDLSVADTVRIWMPVNTITLQVTIVG
jgi:hypothetical protein